ENKLEILDYCKKIKHELEQINEKNSVVIDQSDKSSGEKHYYWELKGVPFRIEVGEKELNEMKLSIKDRLGNKYSIKFDSLNKEFVNKLEKEFDDKIKQKATDFFKSLINKIEKKEDFKNLKGLGIAGWCENENCEKEIRENYHVEVRGYNFEHFDNKKKMMCIVCNKDGYEYYWGKPY
ncbi:MAG: His/Gly/Thr/Pro-type tRNA ligase C-terminal domain-containing protein, partial [Candidatus Anstonellales archaeon]